MATLHPEMLRIERRTIVVDDDGATIDDPSGVAVELATGADADAVTREFFRILNGGQPLELPLATDQERAYADVMAAGLAAFEAAGQQLSEPDGDPRVELERFMETVFAELGRLESLVAGTDPPASLAAEHELFRGALSHILAQEQAFREAAAAAEGDDFWTLMQAGIEATGLEQSMNAVWLACVPIADYLALRGGSMSCAPFGS